MLQEDLDVLKAEQKDKEELEKRKWQGKKVSRKIQLREVETRRIIDYQLKVAGWEAYIVNLIYWKGTMPQKGRNLVIVEWTMFSTDRKISTIYEGISGD